MYKVYADKATCDGVIAYLDARSNAEGHKIPETKDMHVSGSRVDRDKLDWSKMLAQHRVYPRKHPDKEEYAIVCNEFVKRHISTIDAVDDLPEDWTADDVIVVETRR